MPIPFNPARLDEGGGIESTLIRNEAKYHQSCKLMFNTTKLERAQKRKSTTTDESTTGNVRCKRRRLSDNGPRLFECCLCEKEDDLSNLRQAMTMRLNERLHQCATVLNDGKLSAKLSGGDVVALELKYHAGCLTALYNRERAHLNSIKRNNCEERDEDLFPIAFSELVIYINERNVANEASDPVIFRLADLASLYKQRLRQLGALITKVNATRLKEQLLTQVPELEAYKQGRDILLAFKTDVCSVLHDATKYSQAVHLAKAAAIIRKEMLNHKTRTGLQFDGCVEESIPQVLLQFVCSIEHGGDIQSHLKHGVVKSDLSLAQLLQYNCFNKGKDSTIEKHSRNRETPFAVYTGMTVFAKTRKRQLIDKLHENGISISYDRVMEISAQLGESVTNQYVEDGVVCPPILRKGLFTTSAVDNIDHNPTATTATSSFHGTSISIFQHPTSDNKGEQRPQPHVGNSKVKKVPELPESFTSVPPAFLQNKNPVPPDPQNNCDVHCAIPEQF